MEGWTRLSKALVSESQIAFDNIAWQRSNSADNDFTKYLDYEDDSPSDSEIDTWVFPLVQAGMFDIRVDEAATKDFFRTVERNSQTYLASGYFNLTKPYMDSILHQAKGDFHILTASPQANGFFGAGRVMNGIPQAYTLIAKNFQEQICACGLQDRIRLYEYYRNGWTFHAKGLWYYSPGSDLPTLTFIGSPNFGRYSRSLCTVLYAFVLGVSCKTFYILSCL